MKKIIFSLLISFISYSSFGQVFKIQPYLQNAEPNSIYILWETDFGEESVVEWGLTNALGFTGSGGAVQTTGAARLHEVKLDNLNRFTTYYYRVKTNTTYSNIFSFKTPPFASDNEDFRIIAMSDMQRDGSNPNKYSEIINDGIIAFLEDEVGGELTDNLALVMIPGDLVNNGNDLNQWVDQFFLPSQNLYNQVPFYSVLGNHENNSNYYFMYVNLPENGSPGLEEHWWYKDYGNVRIIGLDSNGAYTTQQQLDWLENLLNTTCSDSSINFVFAQLHHPFKSELWTPGELNYTGEVISLLENFTTNCEKPSIHFFGHTHGYSRGQSRDHKHVMINVATSGGAIDHWGEYPQFDYDEFTKSQDEWGFVSVEVINDSDPRFIVKRISRGNEENFRDNEITDSLTIRLNSYLINAPLGLFPNNEEVNPECVILKANVFSSEETGAFHGQSHWQIANDCDFSNPIAESWKNFENYYFEENTQEDDDLTDEKFEGLTENNSYCWRVRYRDRELNWSDWSTPLSFTTSESPYSDNLLENSGAENDLNQWNVIEGVVEALTDGECNGTNPNSGNKYFAVGGLCEESPFARCVQNVDVSSFSSFIDAGGYQLNFGGYLSNYSGSDLPEIRCLFLDENGINIGSTENFSSLSSSWFFINELEEIPISTRTIQMELTGTRNSGVDNDSYFDDLFIKVGELSENCSQILAINNVSITPTLKVIPNPWVSEVEILLPKSLLTNITLELSNSLGQKINSNFEYKNNSLIIKRGSLKTGVYFFVIKQEGSNVGKGKFIVK
ncbi:MAG: fibronectin type III domain-containing protein [Flavobacteriaceae bacterium]|nr:fibronectin type III domain-containing protein [Flavobacteriaceae bacterium]